MGKTLEERLGITTTKTKTTKPKTTTKKATTGMTLEERLGITKPKSKEPTSTFADFRQAEQMHEDEVIVQPEKKIPVAAKALQGIGQVAKAAPSSILATAGGIDIGATNILKTLDYPLSAGAAKLESLVTGKEVKASDTFTQRKLEDLLKRLEIDTAAQSEKVQELPTATRLPVQAIGQVAQLPFYGAGKIASLGFMGATAGGSKAREVEQEQEALGKDTGTLRSKAEQVGGGLLGGAAEAITEAGPVGKVIDAIGGKVTGKAIGQMMASEFLGEAASQAVDPYISKLAIPESELPTFKEQVTGVLDAGFTGAIGAVLMVGAGKGFNKSIQALQNPTQENVDAAVEEVKATTPEIQDVDTTQAIEKPTVETKNINKMNQGEMVQELASLGKEVTGSKAELRNRLNLARQEGVKKPAKLDDFVKKPVQPTTQPITTTQPTVEATKKAIQQEISLPDVVESVNSIESIKTPVKGLRKTFQTIQDSPTFSKKAKTSLKSSDFGYTKITNEETLNAVRAERRNVQDFMQLENLRNEKDTATGVELMRKASESNDMVAFDKVSVKLATMLTDAGRSVQAASIMNKLTPEGTLHYLNKQTEKFNKTVKQQVGAEDIRTIKEAAQAELQIVEQQIKEKKGTKMEMDSLKRKRNQLKMNLQTFADVSKLEGANEATVKKVLKKHKIEYKDLTKDNIDAYIDQIVRKTKTINLTDADRNAIKAKIKESMKLEGRKKDVAIAEAYKIFNDKLPASRADKLGSLQRISMLLNLKTQSRNVVGNAIMQVAEFVKDVPATAIDIATSKITGERTTDLVKMADLSKGLTGAKKGLYEAYDDWHRGIDTRIDRGQYEARVAKIFPTNSKHKAVNLAAKGLNEANDITSLLLSAGDRPFFEASLAIEKSRLERLGVENAEMKAIDIALEKTFQNRSHLASVAVDVRNRTGIFGRLVLPYAYTPANITDKVFDYSPLGSIRVIKNNLYRDIKNGEFNQRQFADRLGRNITGSALMYLGYMLRKAGVITGAFSDDKDERAFQQSTGMQDYAFTNGNIYVNFDWAQPIAVPLAAGANLYEDGLDKTTAKKSIFDAIAQASIASANTLEEQPLLQGVAKLFSYGSLTENAADIVRTSPLQVVPLLSTARAARQVVDPNMRMLDYNSLIESFKNQVPGLSDDLPVRRNPLGEVAQYTGSTLQKLASPASITELNMNKVEQEIADVFKEVGDKDIFPKAKVTSFSEGGVEYTLTSQEQSDFQYVMGSYTKDRISELLDLSGWQSLEPIEKNAIMINIIKESYDVAKGDYIESNR